jgi:hypothetical protein
VPLDSPVWGGNDDEDDEDGEGGLDESIYDDEVRCRDHSSSWPPSG